jgi:hypothetical protein
MAVIVMLISFISIYESSFMPIFNRRLKRFMKSTTSMFHLLSKTGVLIVFSISETVACPTLASIEDGLGVQKPNDALTVCDSNQNAFLVNVKVIGKSITHSRTLDEVANYNGDKSEEKTVTLESASPVDQSVGVAEPVIEKQAKPEKQQYEKGETSPYTLKALAQDVTAVKTETFATFAGITAIGVKSWNWGSSDFHFNSENWFGKNTSSFGMDKLGHAFSSYTITNLLAQQLKSKGRSPERAALSAALLAQGLMLYVEAFDGFSNDHGFSKEDVTMNLLGTGLAYLRQRYPKVRALVDYRMEYIPSSSGYKNFRPMSDYAGQKFVLAFKMSGVDKFKKTPLKYLELHTGYYARGFSKAEKADNKLAKRNLFVGIGLNLSELLFGSPIEDEAFIKPAGRTFFEHVQVPHTSTHKVF